MGRKKALVLALALLLLLAANLRVQYSVSVGGQALSGHYSPRALRRCEAAAEEAAEEILRGHAAMPALQRRGSLRLARPDGDTEALTDALLRAVPGVKQSDCVFVNGVRLGTVADGALLCEKLRASILGQMPTAAVFGNISGQLQLHRVYTRVDRDTNDEDMILLITGMAPVIYVDRFGKLA